MNFFLTFNNKMKKVLIREDSLDSIKSVMDANRLPNFLFKQLKKHRTSLGDNPAFPPEGQYPFDYKVTKERFNEVVEAIEKMEGLESKDEDYLVSTLSKLIKECIEREKPIREFLEQTCENVINKVFLIPDGSVSLSCKLVDSVDLKKSYRIMPEDDGNNEYEFEDLEDINNSNDVILKRRIINSLIQGASYSIMKDYELYVGKIYKTDKSLLDLYDKIITINDYLLFTREEKITEKHICQAASVDVTLGKVGTSTKIEAEGIIFPYLLAETIRGFFELFASHGLPNDDKKAKYIISHSDFLLAEPWDLRMGVGLWRLFIKNVSDYNIYPYIFSDVCELPTSEFNDIMKNIFANTKKGKMFLSNLYDSIKDDVDYQKFTNDLKLRGKEEKSVIADNIDY